MMERESKDPYGIFSKFFTRHMLEQIFYQTNLFAAQKRNPFKPINLQKLRIFLRINIFMGMKRLPGYISPLIRQLKTVNRSGWILSHIHFNNNLVQPRRHKPNYNKLCKLCPLIAELSDTILRITIISIIIIYHNYHPHQELVVDESMVKFKGNI